jgi:protein TonB
MRSLTFLLTFLWTNAYSQPTNKGTIKVKKEEKKDSIYAVVEQMPEFNGGNGDMMSFISGVIVYPQRAKEAGISGTVHIGFVVNEDGSISDVRVVRGIRDCPECDLEVYNAVKRMPPFKPGRRLGEPVKVYYNLPINFRLK